MPPLQTQAGLYGQGGLYDGAGLYGNAGLYSLGELAPVVDPIQTVNPYLYLDPSQSALATGGGEAGYLDGVEKIINIADGTNAADDPLQTTAIDQTTRLPLIDGGGYLHLPGVAGNTASAPMTSLGGDTILVTTVPVSASANVTATAGSGTVVIGPAASPFYIKSISVTVNAVEELAIDFTNASDAHNATSITATTGQTVTINQSGNDPSTLVRVPSFRGDGVNTGFSQMALAAAISGARLFAAFTVLGDGGSAGGRVLSVNEAGGNDFANPGAVFLQRNSDETRAFFSSPRMARVGGFSGTGLHEVLLQGSSHKHLLNGGAELTDSTALTIAAVQYNLMRDTGGVSSIAIDLHYLVLVPPTITEAQATAIREKIATATGITLV